jgi:hypothetical protein
MRVDWVKDKAVEVSLEKRDEMVREAVNAARGHETGIGFITTGDTAVFAVLLDDGGAVEVYDCLIRRDGEVVFGG